MLEIIWLIYLCKKNSDNAILRGRKPRKYIALTIALWLGSEIIGFGIGTLFGVTPYFVALFFAAGGGVLAYNYAKNGKPDDPINSANTVKDTERKEGEAELDEKRNLNTKNLFLFSILSTVLFLMRFIPYIGYIYIGSAQVISTLHIIVAVGAIILGWKYGAILGFVWGVICMLEMLSSTFYTFQTNLLVNLVPCILVGIIGGLIAQGLRKLRMRPFIVAALAAAIVTVLHGVLSSIAIVIFIDLPYSMPLSVILYSWFGMSGIIELVGAVLFVPVIVALINKYRLKHSTQAKFRVY